MPRTEQSARPGGGVLSAILLLAVASACASVLPGDGSASEPTGLPAEPPPGMEEDDRWAFDCDLSMVMRSDAGTTGAMVGTLTGVAPVARSEFPWDADQDRPHLDLSVLVEEVAAGTPATSPSAGSPMPDLVVGEEAHLVVYYNSSGGMVEQAERLGDNRSRAGFALVALGDFENPAAEGAWGVRRIATIVDGSLRFEGTCGEEITATYAEAAERLGRPADAGLFLDYATEEAALHDHGGPRGPIGQLVYEIETEGSGGRPSDTTG